MHDLALCMGVMETLKRLSKVTASHLLSDLVVRAMVNLTKNQMPIMRRRARRGEAAFGSHVRERAQWSTRLRFDWMVLVCVDELMLLTDSFEKQIATNHFSSGDVS
jgi:hypothetical protein